MSAIGGIVTVEVNLLGADRGRVATTLASEVTG